MLPKILLIVQAISAILLVVVVLLQQKGSGLGAAFGGSSNIFSTRRGIDKVLFRATIAIAVIFFGVAVASLMV
ncbi:MAG: preprotein translocase subunit SecG [Candidatus Magasanikbacteria bacterium RIFCSPLOWO2_01_FULL_43_20b]|uniref:Protein-export membrane protein SecG n=1 Tax=Candidatus Magasanikbacteria bacterium RIFCSPLOWO2_12_FULL_43_12 TaxID=1798692 RepID=A0A1F6MRF4_9BACT|nr:MAG: preprotein translocase subunit SecG [Candidatus Magasanikbacteria bacterium RIFCSPHIGHO2_02_FULL_44_13]OGH72541.1 MAG: preprotein translocase subunit SecG [Candidatus Magasanikbacteria bacterium RIFCSPLOWO2_02_FULL_43_22]OGH73551.1 MAG: preprotein translocase subunit SecG [Candidatus Magasanikbacteria bacterium RIFCSPLOWO2_01_FULL_43_20b]OGH74246.1 MAG: preprotein translocase subunit SecG [Candidatus Magasanikbacteria bacterium RIFCSPLOWO2_12_FULL_43_12]